LRGFAALWVVLYHMSEGHHIPIISTVIPAWLVSILFDAGHLGVPIFFVLSGFVMAYTVKQTPFSGKNANKFLLRRFIRLSPPYYFAIAVALALNLVKAKALGVAALPISLNDVIAHMTYLQLLFSSTEINAVFWTLSIEVQFYFAFAFLIFISDSIYARIQSSDIRLIVFCIFALLAILWPSKILNISLWKGDFLTYWYSFISGVLVCWGYIEKGRSRLVAVFYTVILFIIGITYDNLFTITVAITSLALTIAGIRDTMGKWLSWRWIQSLALISYSLYLLHNPLTGATFNIISRWLPHGLNAELVGLASSLLICILASWITYETIEKTSINWSHAIKLKKQITTIKPI